MMKKGWIALLLALCMMLGAAGLGLKMRKKNG